MTKTPVFWVLAAFFSVQLLLGSIVFAEELQFVYIGNTDQPHFEYYSSEPAKVSERDADGNIVRAKPMPVNNWEHGSSYSNTGWSFGNYRDYYFVYEGRQTEERIFVEGYEEWIKAEYLSVQCNALRSLYYEIWPDGSVWWSQCGGDGVYDTGTTCSALQPANARILATIGLSNLCRQDASYYRWVEDPHWENVTIEKWDLYRKEGAGTGYRLMKEGWNFVNGAGEGYVVKDKEIAAVLVENPFMFSAGEGKAESNSAAGASALPLAAVGVIGTVAIAGVYMGVRTVYGSFLLKRGVAMLGNIGTGGGFMGSGSVRQEKGNIIGLSSSPASEYSLSTISAVNENTKVVLIRDYGSSYDASTIDRVEGWISYYRTGQNVEGKNMPMSEATKLAAMINYEESVVEKAYGHYRTLWGEWKNRKAERWEPDPILVGKKMEEGRILNERLTNLKNELAYTTGLERRPNFAEKLIGPAIDFILDVSRIGPFISILIKLTVATATYSNSPGERYFGGVVPKRFELETPPKYTAPIFPTPNPTPPSSYATTALPNSSYTLATSNTVDMSVLWPTGIPQKYINSTVTYVPGQPGPWLSVANTGLLGKTASRVEVLSAMERFSVSDFYTTAEKWTGPSSRDAVRAPSQIYDIPTKSTYSSSARVSSGFYTAPTKSTYSSPSSGRASLNTTAATRSGYTSSVGGIRAGRNSVL